MRPPLLAALMILASCDAEPPPSPVEAASAKVRTVEVPAEALPTDKQIAAAINYRLARNIDAMEARGVIVEPDMMRSVVRKAQCRFAPRSRSRAHCRYEYHRSPIAKRSYVEAVEWVASMKDWEALSGTFVHMRESAPAGLPERLVWREAGPVTR